MRQAREELGNEKQSDGWHSRARRRGLKLPRWQEFTSDWEIGFSCETDYNVYCYSICHLTRFHGKVYV